MKNRNDLIENNIVTENEVVKSSNDIETNLITNNEVVKQSNNFSESLNEIKRKLLYLNEKRYEYLDLQKEFRKLSQEFLSEYENSHQGELKNFLN